MYYETFVVIPSRIDITYIKKGIYSGWFSVVIPSRIDITYISR